jgi:putative transposase
MKRSRFTESQIVEILKEADAGLPTNEVWRKHGISSAGLSPAGIPLVG